MKKFVAKKFNQTTELSIVWKRLQSWKGTSLSRKAVIWVVTGNASPQEASRDETDNSWEGD